MVSAADDNLSEAKEDRYGLKSCSSFEALGARNGDKSVSIVYDSTMHSHSTLKYPFSICHHNICYGSNDIWIWRLLYSCDISRH